MDWTGYKVHFTETCDEERVHLITHVETTHAAVPDEQVLPHIHEALETLNVLPETHLVDAGYTTAKVLADSQHDYGVSIVGPVAHDASWQAKAGEGLYSRTRRRIEIGTVGFDCLRCMTGVAPCQSAEEEAFRLRYNPPPIIP